MKTRILKLLIMTLAMSSSICTFGENYLKPGLKWATQSYYHNQDGPQTHVTEGVLKDTVVNNIPCLQALAKGSDESEYKLRMLLRLDDQKVYQSLPDSIDWKLLYDFGLQPDDTTTVYTRWDKNYRTTVVKAVKTIPATDNTGLEYMVMQELYDGKPMDLNLYWIKGLGSDLGILQNIGINLSPTPGFLTSVTLDDKVIYKRSSGIDNMEDSPEAWNISISNSSIYITGLQPSTKIAIYTLQGSTAAIVNATYGTTVVSGLSKGTYIIKANGLSKKIIL